MAEESWQEMHQFDHQIWNVQVSYNYTHWYKMNKWVKHKMEISSFLFKNEKNPIIQNKFTTENREFCSRRNLNNLDNFLLLIITLNGK